MAAPNKYFLGNSEYSTLRLRLQFELTRRNFNNHLLDPKIPLAPGMRVADVATGTGVFAIDIAEDNPDVTVEGLDINLAHVSNAKAWIPSNVSFRLLDVTESIPDEFVGRYDVVNIQYAMVFVRDANFGEVLERLMAMLKPGGWLQWTDADMDHFRWVTGSGNDHPPELNKLQEIHRGQLRSETDPRTWTANLDKEFTKAGLEDVIFIKPQNKASVWPAMLENWFAGSTEAVANLHAMGHITKENFDGWAVQRERAMKESADLQIGMDFGITRACGRKAQA